MHQPSVESCIYRLTDRPEMLQSFSNWIQNKFWVRAKTCEHLAVTCGGNDDQYHLISLPPHWKIFIHVIIKQNLTTNTCSYFSSILITHFSSNGSNYLVTLFWCELNIVNSTGCWCPTSSLVIAGDHPAADRAAGRRPEGVRTLVRHEDGEHPHRRDQMPPPGHHHVPGAHDPHGDVVDDGCPQVHEQFAGQEEEWRHELRVRILREVCNKKIWFFFVGPSQFWSLLKKAFT